MALFVGIAALAVGPALVRGEVVGQGVDVDATLWMFWWFQECLRTLQSPLHGSLQYFPDGHALFTEMGGNFLDTALAAPFALLGHPRWQPVFAGAVLVANGLGFHVLARGLMKPGAALVAAAAWTANPYVLHELAYGRLSQAFLVFLPLALHHFVRLRGPRDAALAGLFTGLQAWIYWYDGFFLALAFAPLAVVGLRERARPALLALSGGVALATVLPGVLPMALAAASTGIPAVEAAPFSLTELPPAVDNGAMAMKGWWEMEQVGSPLLVSAAWGIPTLIWLVRGPGRARWLPVLVLSLAFALGPRVQLGEQGFVMPHYLAAWHLVPFFDRFWHPYRFLAVGLVPAALALGFLAERLERAWVVAPAFLVLTLVEHRGYGTLPLCSTDRTPSTLVSWLGEQDGAVVELPFEEPDGYMVWQTFHRRPSLGGRTASIPAYWPEGTRQRLEQPFFSALRTAGHGRSAAQVSSDAARAEGFRWVALWRGSLHGGDQQASRAVQALHVLLGPPVAVDGGLVLWDLEGRAVPPEATAATAARLAEPYPSDRSLHAIEQEVLRRGQGTDTSYGVPDPGRAP